MISIIKQKMSLFIAIVLIISVLIVSAFYIPNAKAQNTLDIAQFEETFSETFRGKLDVTPREGPSRWIAHTPYNGDFGDARFMDPKEGFPFQTGPNGLKIIARKNDAGKWESGLLSSKDKNGRGFTQAMGYFEARIKMPKGPGVWPAFWLIADGHPYTKAEIDVVEYYGHATDKYEIALHHWPKDKTKKKKTTLKKVKVLDNSLTSDFHTYGVEITPSHIIYYLDRSEVARIPATNASHFPMYILVNLALGSGWPIDETPNPSIMEVDYVKAFKRVMP